MANITTRQDFENYCLRRLGFPVIEINVDDDQLEDRIDDAIQYWQDYHFDGLQKIYYIKRLDATDINNKYIDLTNVVDSANVPLDIVGITRIFPLQDSQATINMFDLRYQLRLNELYDFTSASYVNYTLTQQHLRSLEMLFTGEVPIRFNRHMKKLFIDWAWGASEAPSGTIVVAEAYACIDATVYNRVWNDRWIKEYTTALFKRSWANNLKKFSGLQLPGGVTLNGDKIYEEAAQEIERLEKEFLAKTYYDASSKALWDFYVLAYQRVPKIFSDEVKDRLHKLRVEDVFMKVVKLDLIIILKGRLNLFIVMNIKKKE